MAVARLERGPCKGAKPWHELVTDVLSWHKEVILGRNSVLRVFRLYLRSSDPCFNALSKYSC